MTVVLIILAILTAPLWLGLLWILVMLLWMAILWAFGAPITIKVEGKKIGYLQWFKFHRIRDYE